METTATECLAVSKSKIKKGPRQRGRLGFGLAAVVILLSTALALDGALARERRRQVAAPAAKAEVERDEQGRRVVYKSKNVVDFDAMLLEGDIKNPNEFYFVHRPEEKYGSLVKKRKNFHKEMLRDSLMIR